MLSRRGFASCAVCAAIGKLTATAAEAQNLPAGMTRTILQSTDLPGGKYVTVLVDIRVAASALVPRHIHPGIESAYVVEGAGELSVKGQPDRSLRAGDSFHIPPETPHAWKNGDAPTKLVSTFVVEKDKPLASPAPE
jgi:quercetin dioxygenase-like cupin family protein